MSEETLSKYGFFFLADFGKQIFSRDCCRDSYLQWNKKRLKITNLDHINLIKDV